MRLRPDSFVLLVTLLALPTFAEPRSLIVVPHPLEFDPRPELSAVGDKLRGAWIDAVREAGEVVTPSRREVDAASTEVGRRDCRTSDDCLAALALKGAGLYAVHAFVELSEANVFTVSARVVRDDGKLMASFSMQQARGDKKKPLVPLVKAVLLETVKGLGLARLPTFKEAARAPRVEPVPEALPLPPPPPPPPPVAAQQSPPAPTTGTGRRTVGFVTLGVGAAAAVVGTILVVRAQGEGRALMVDELGRLPSAEPSLLDRARSANAQNTLGLGLLLGGGGVAVLGLVLALIPVAPSVAVWPTADGLAFSGVFP